MPSSLLKLNIPPRRDVNVALRTLAREDYERARSAQVGFERFYKPQPWRWAVELKRRFKAWQPPRWLRMTVIVTGCLTLIAMGWICLWLWMAL